MKNIAVIYDNLEESHVLEMETFLKTSYFHDQLEKLNLENCNLWLPFDFHLYEAGLKLRPKKDRLTKEDIHDLAINEFSWLTKYFAINGVENLEKIIANEGYIINQLRMTLQKNEIHYDDNLLYQIKNQDYHCITDEKERETIIFIRNTIQQQFLDELEKDRAQKIALGNQMALLIVSTHTEDTITNLKDIVFTRTCYFIEQAPKQNVQQKEETRTEMIKMLKKEKALLKKMSVPYFSPIHSVLPEKGYPQNPYINIPSYQKRLETIRK